MTFDLARWFGGPRTLLLEMGKMKTMHCHVNYWPDFVDTCELILSWSAEMEYRKLSPDITEYGKTWKLENL